MYNSVEAALKKIPWPSEVGRMNEYSTDCFSDISTARNVSTKCRLMRSRLTTLHNPECKYTRRSILIYFYKVLVFH